MVRQHRQGPGLRPGLGALPDLAHDAKGPCRAILGRHGPHRARGWGGPGDAPDAQALRSRWTLSRRRADGERGLPHASLSIVPRHGAGPDARAGMGDIRRNLALPGSGRERRGAALPDHRGTGPALRAAWPPHERPRGHRHDRGGRVARILRQPFDAGSRDATVSQDPMHGRGDGPSVPLPTATAPRQAGAGPLDRAVRPTGRKWRNVKPDRPGPLALGRGHRRV
jgi:hypothetical protein